MFLDIAQPSGTHIMGQAFPHFVQLACCAGSLQQPAIMRVIGEEILLKGVELGDGRQAEIQRIGLREKGARPLVCQHVGSRGSGCAFVGPVTTSQLMILNNGILLERIKVDQPVRIRGG